MVGGASLVLEYLHSYLPAQSNVTISNTARYLITAEPSYEHKHKTKSTVRAFLVQYIDLGSMTGHSSTHFLPATPSAYSQILTYTDDDDTLSSSGREAGHDSSKLTLIMSTLRCGESLISYIATRPLLTMADSLLACGACQDNHLSSHHLDLQHISTCLSVARGHQFDRA